MKKSLLLFVLLYATSCGHQDLQKNNEHRNIKQSPSVCEANADNLREMTGPIRKHEFDLSQAKNMTIKKLEDYYKNGITDYDSQIKVLNGKYLDVLNSCKKDSKAVRFLSRKIEYLHELKVKRFLSYYFLISKKEEERDRLEFYSKNLFKKRDNKVQIKLKNLDPSFAKFVLELSSLNSTSILPVNAVTLTTYLREDGLQAPLEVLTGVRVFDEFGNRYTQTSDPSTLQEIYPGKPSEFKFSTKPLMKSAKFAILKIEPKAFGNDKELVLKVPLYRANSQPFYIAVYEEFGIDGLKAESRRCTQRWHQQNSSFMPLPVSVDDVKACALVDMLIGRVDLKKKESEASDTEFSKSEIARRFSDRLGEKFELSEKAISQLLEKWRRQSISHFAEIKDTASKN